MDPPPTAPSEWISTRNRPVAVNRRGGGLAGCEVVGNNKPVRRRRRVIRRWGSNPDESPSPPRSPPRIKLPISPGRYGTLRSPPTVRPVSTWTGPPPPREGYVYVPRFQELTPSPPRGDGSVRPPFRWATPHQATERPARRLTFSAAPSVEQSPQIVDQPPPSPPPSAVEEEGLTDSDPLSKMHVYYYRDGFPVYFPFHPTTEEWASCDREADRLLHE